MTILMVAVSKSARLNWFAVCYLFSVAISGVYAINISEWVYAILRTVLFVTFLTVVEIDRKLLAKTMIALGMIFTGYFWYDYLVNDSVRGLMRMQNWWAAAHLLVIPFCYYAITKKFWKHLAIAVLVSMIVNICIINSRSSLLALGLIGLIALISHKKTYILVGLLSILLCLLVFKFDSLLNSKSLHQRFEQWKPTSKLIVDNLWGVGAGNYWIVFPKYAGGMDYPNVFDRTSFRHPHNDYLWAFSELGLTGFICYLGMFVSALYFAIKKKQIWLIMGLTGYMTIAFFSALHERAFMSLMLATMIAIAFKGVELKNVWVVIPILLFAMVVFGYRYRSSCWNKKLRACYSQWQEVIDCTQGYSVFSTLTYTGLPYHWWSGTGYLKTGRTNIASEHFAKAYKHNPYNIHVINGYGVNRFLNKDVQGAKRCFEYALEICPDFEDAKKNLAKFK